MVVLVSFLLVLAAAVTLVVGLLQSGLTLIYLSIGCSVVAGLVLAVAVLRGRPEPKAASAPARPYSPPPEPAYSSSSTSSFSTAPEPETGDESWRVDTPAPASRRFGRPATVAVEEPEAEPEPSPVAGYARRAAGAGASTSPSVISSEMPEPVVRGGFPLPDFDELRAPELLRRVEELDIAQLEQVREREAAGKARSSILSRIDARIESLREPGWEIDDATWEGGDAAPADRGAEADVAEADLDAGDDFEDEPEPAPEPAGPAPDADLPIADYDGLRVGQILPLLRDLDEGELEAVRQYEAAGKSRSGILDRIAFLAAGGTRPTVTAAAVPPPAAAAAPAAAPAKAAGTTSIAAAVAAAKAKQAKKG
ncbi:MAG TPA: hypothetical protein VM942_02250 [Acidimicrobiales bacterium]|nr:hypothetical protein [Acidimicrobiales bacterium]